MNLVLSNSIYNQVIDANAALDDQTLGALGYKQEFKR